MTQSKKSINEILTEIQVCSCKTAENDGLLCPSYQQKVLVAVKQIKELILEKLKELEKKGCMDMNCNCVFEYNQALSERVREKGLYGYEL